MKAHKTARAAFSLVLSLSMALAAFPAQLLRQAYAADDFGIANPRVETVLTEPAGLKTIWDCVEFGSYPQAEVSSSQELINAKWDENNEAVIDGVRYRRLIKEEREIDGVTWAPNITNSSAWGEFERIKYFRYEPIKWRVLQVNGTQALLLADKGLDDQPYNTYYAELANWSGVTWKESSIRSWLNGYAATENQPATDYSNNSFIARAFSETERAAIKETAINYKDGSSQGGAVNDRVFLLSASVVSGETAEIFGFPQATNAKCYQRACFATAYARYMGADNFTNDDTLPVNAVRWWLRDPSNDAKKGFTWAASTYFGGHLDLKGDEVNINKYAVRPALWLDLESAAYSVVEPMVSGDMANIAGCEVSLEPTECVYNGEAQTPAVTVSNGAATLVAGQHYNVVYNNNIDASTEASVTITGTGTYKGEISTNFTIKPATITSVEVKGGPFSYSGNEHRPELTVYAGELEVPADSYEATYAANTDAGEASVTVKGKGNYEGEASANFAIEKAKITKVEVNGGPFIYNGEAHEPELTVYAGELEVPAEGYNAEYFGNTEAGTAHVRVEGKGNFSETVSAEFTIDEPSGGEEEEAAYTVEFYHMGKFGIWPTKPSKTVELKGKVGQEVSVNTATDIQEGYTLSEYKKSTLKGTLTADTKLSLKVYCDIAKGPESCFDDVRYGVDANNKPLDWFHRVVHRCKDFGLVEGKGDGKNYDPNGRITRAQIAVILWRMSGAPRNYEYKGFTDVKKTYQQNGETKQTYYWYAVGWAQKFNVMTGVSTTRFEPNGNITRQQLAAALYKYVRNYKGRTDAVGKGTEYKAAKDQAKVNGDMKYAVGWCYKQKVMTGNDEGYLKPTGTASRGETAKMVLFIYEFLNKEA